MSAGLSAHLKHIYTDSVKVMPCRANGVLVSGILQTRHLLLKDSRGFFVLRVRGRRISGKIGFGTRHRVIR
jgi:hypothetical protein